MKWARKFLPEGVNTRIMFNYLENPSVKEEWERRPGSPGNVFSSGGYFHCFWHNIDVYSVLSSVYHKHSNWNWIEKPAGLVLFIKKQIRARTFVLNFPLRSFHILFTRQTSHDAISLWPRSLTPLKSVNIRQKRLFYASSLAVSGAEAERRNDFSNYHKQTRKKYIKMRVNLYFREDLI